MKQHFAKDPMTQRGQATKKKILAAAEKLFGTKGYYETSVVDITREAGVAQGSFYTYFESKYELYKTLLEHLNREFRYHIQQKVQSIPDFQDKLRVGISTFLSWVKEHRHLYSIVQQAVVIDEQLYRAYYEKIAEGHLRTIEQAEWNEAIDVSHREVLAYALMGMSQFIGMRWVYWEHSSDVDKAVDVLMVIIFEGLNHLKKGE